MSSVLFTIPGTLHEGRRLARLLKKACKSSDSQPELNRYFGTLCKRYGHTDPESCQITVIGGGTIVVQDYPSFDEIIAAHRAKETSQANEAAS